MQASESPSLAHIPYLANNWAVGPFTRAHGRPPVRTTGIHTLPTELLAYIFLFLVPLGYFPVEMHDIWQHDWIYLDGVLRVCRGWRSIVLSHSCLWTYVYPLETNITLWARNLRLSGVMPLDVFLDMESICCSTMLEVLAQHAGRVRSLAIMLSISGVEDGLKSLEDALCDVDAPLLERLFIVPRNTDERIDDDEHMVGPSLPRLFSHTLPRLRTLDVSDISHFPNGMFKHLTDLSLALLDFATINTTIRDVLELLQESRQTLRTIYLWDAFCTDLDEDMDAEPPRPVAFGTVFLHNLERVTIKDAPCLIKQLFSYLRFPPSATVVITADLYREEFSSGGFSPLAVVLSPELSHCLAAPLQSATRLAVGAHSSFPTFRLLDDCGNLKLFLEFASQKLRECDGYAVLVRRCLQHLCALLSPNLSFVPLPIHRIHELTLTIPSFSRFFDASFWLAFFKGFPNLKTINLTVPDGTGGVCVCLLGALACAANLPIPCDKLRTLRIRCEPDDVLSSLGGPLSNLTAYTLHSVAKSRAEKDIALDELVLFVGVFGYADPTAPPHSALDAKAVQTCIFEPLGPFVRRLHVELVDPLYPLPAPEDIDSAMDVDSDEDHALEQLRRAKDVDWWLNLGFS